MTSLINFIIYKSLMFSTLRSQTGFKVQTITVFSYERIDVIPFYDAVAFPFLAAAPGFMFLAMLSIVLSWIRVTEQVSFLFGLSRKGIISKLCMFIKGFQLLLFMVLIILLAAGYSASIQPLVAVGSLFLVIFLHVGRSRFLKVVRQTR